MTRITRKRLIYGGIAAVVLAAIIYGFLPDPIAVQTAVAERGPLQVTVEEEGETRVRDRYVVTAPVAAHMRRMDVEVGDAVRAGQTLVQLEPPRAAMLDPRTRAEAAARLDAARASLERAELLAERAVAERERTERLAAAGSATAQAREQAVADAAQAVAARDAARAEVEAIRATLGTAGAGQGVMQVLSAPVSGSILAIHRESGGHVNPGEPLVEIGDVGELEVTVDVLSQDAVRIQPGTRVILDQWGEGVPLDAVVRRVAPHGFTAVSALGVEERRVQVSADITSPPEVWRPLGTGYRVVAQFVIWEADDVLQVPTAALFRVGDGWAVFLVQDGRAVLTPVTVGRQTGLAAQIISGLEPGDRVIVHPPSAVDDGSRVAY